MIIPFHKMHGLGNDFVLIDMRESRLELSAQQLAFIANRRLGVGCDQILTLESANRANVLASYKIYNQDGSRAEHCGNGVRCVAKYLHERTAEPCAQLIIDMNGRDLNLIITSNGEVRVDMGPPVFLPTEIPTTFVERTDRYEIDVHGQRYQGGLVSMGNPHAVFPVDDVSKAPVETLGLALQSHDKFPNRVNVGFMQVVERDAIKLRVYERGVGETAACGTGACAAMVIGRLWGSLDRCVRVALTGGDLTIEWGGGDTDPVWMTGPATYVYEGRISL